MSICLLVTGSRYYPAERSAIVRRILLPYLAGITPANRHEYVLRHGDGRPNRDAVGSVTSGLDWIAADIWSKEGGVLDAMPADWGTYGDVAGPVRNKEMVRKDPKPDVCVGFPWFSEYSRSAGTKGCMYLASKAGISTWEAKVDGTLVPYSRTKNLPGLW